MMFLIKHVKGEENWRHRDALKTCSFKAREHWIGELKVFDTVQTYDCVGSWAEQGTDTGGRPRIFNYLDFCIYTSEGLRCTFYLPVTLPSTPKHPIIILSIGRQSIYLVYCQLLISLSIAGVCNDNTRWFVKVSGRMKQTSELRSEQNERKTHLWKYSNHTNYSPYF